ncbi:Na/Pi cotransporter family protein [Rhodobacteraceae bacterium CCMM004]|nr:Na/Pi cotransporter family protein [Rhodobacteraceae bacterium CCMM004]
MALIAFSIQLLSAATLLLFSVRFLRIGVERLWSAKIRNRLGPGTSKGQLLLNGALLGFGMQGATVVALMAAGLGGAGTIPLLSATVLAIGADVGSAMAVVFLTLPISQLGPLAILIGGWMYLNVSDPRSRNIGRVILGLGLIFLSLTLIRAAVAPLSGFSGNAALLGYLQQDLVTVAIAGCIVTLVMHSSLAALLSAMAFAGPGGVEVATGLAFVLGCNVGSALLPIWLLRRSEDAGKIAIVAVAVLRVLLAGVFLLVLSAMPGVLSAVVDRPVDQAMLVGHLVFNTVLLALVPAAPVLVGALSARLSPPSRPSVPGPAVSDDPAFALAALKGMVNHMLSVLEAMLAEAMAPKLDPAEMARRETEMNEGLAKLRRAYAGLSDRRLSESVEVQGVVDYAIRVEACGDILSGTYARIRSEGASGLFELTPQGQQEIQDLAAEVFKGLHLAQSVFWSGDLDAAARLVQHKQDVTRQEEVSRRNHLGRVSTGNLTSLSSSNQHLELIAALKSINSKLATVGYAVLDTHGALRRSRLKNRFEVVTDGKA